MHEDEVEQGNTRLDNRRHLIDFEVHAILRTHELPLEAAERVFNDEACLRVRVVEEPLQPSGRRIERGLQQGTVRERGIPERIGRGICFSSAVRATTDCLQSPC